MPGLMSYADALALVLAISHPMEPESIPLEAAAGRVLAEVPAIDTPLPAFANSAMDGFAVRVQDVPQPGVSLPLTDGAGHAGFVPPPLRAGHAAPISTGAPIPAGADAVVPVEWTTRQGPQVRFDRPVDDRFVRPVGSDLPAGPAPLAVGTVLGPAEGALLASIGATTIRVVRRPRVAILSTGAELVPPTHTPQPGQIRNSNSTALEWACRRLGADTIVLGTAGDEAHLVRPLLERGLHEADLLITSAGVSVGERDLVRSCLTELGAESHAWGVDLKPGKPVAIASRGSVPIVSLPGNPASALVCFTLFAAPAVRARAGWTEPKPRLVAATTSGQWPAPEARLHAVRCRTIDGPDGLEAIPTGDQSSHRIGSLVGADAVALVEPGRTVSGGERIATTALPGP